MRTTILLCYLCCFICFHSIAQTSFFQYKQDTTLDFQEIDQAILQKIKQYTADSVLVVLDIDNTILITDVDLGGDIWFQWQHDPNFSPTPTPTQRIDQDSIFIISNLLHNLGTMHLIDTLLPTYLDVWQKAGVSVLALTARDPAIRGATERELKRNGLLFENKPIKDIQGNILCYDYIWGKQCINYTKGILMMRGGDKGSTLAHIISRAGNIYKAIIFADDTYTNIESMKKQYAQDGTIDVDVFWYCKVVEDRKKQNKGQVLTEEQAINMAKDWDELKKSLNKIFKR